MKILTRYLTKEFLKLLLLCQIVFLSIYLIIDFLQKIDNLIEASATKEVIFAYFFNKAPLVIVQMLPPSTLISVIILFSLMKKRNEITAMKACGLDIFKASQSLLAASFVVGTALFLFSEIVVPHTTSKANEIWDIQVDKRDPTQFYGREQIWYKGTGIIYWMQRFDYKRKTMEYPTFYFFDDSFRLIKRVDGRKAVWEGGKWKVEEGIVQEPTNGGDYRLTQFADLYLKLTESPETFVRRVRDPEEMSYWQLKRYAKRVHLEGYDNSRYLVDMNIKIAFAFIIIIMVLIGIPISLRVERGGIPFAIFMGICLCFLYIVILGLARSLGLSSVLPPLLAAWVANLLFFLLGIHLMMGIER
jgi:lipopolysaccharide export system permease protein